VRREDNFFDLGGHSLLSLSAIGQMEQATGIRVNPRRYIFESFAQIAAAYAGPSAPAATAQLAASELVAPAPSPHQHTTIGHTSTSAATGSTQSAPTAQAKPARQTWLQRLLRKH
jgi:hypothetical protein